MVVAYMSIAMLLVTWLAEPVNTPRRVKKNFCFNKKKSFCSQLGS